ncbi:MAG TPA: flagellar biosynthetic protein FliO [Caldimonas sp.]
MISQGFTSLLWFLAILALIPLALWLLKRTPMGGSAAQGMLRSVAALPLSASQRIVTVEVGQGAAQRWLVLGVTPHSITTLHVMEPQAELPGSAAPVPPQAAFAQLLGRLRQAKGGPREH